MMSIHRRAFIGAAGLAGAACFAPLPAWASDKSDAEALVAKARAAVTALAGDSDFASMKSALGRAQAVLIFPQVIKVGLVLGGAGGSGVLLVRDAGTGAWSGPAFYTMASASLGLQAGASAAEMVMLVNSPKALEKLYSNSVKLGADASAALGSRGAEKGAVMNTDFVAYSKVKGAFAGVAVDGAVLDVRQTLNSAYYGQAVTPSDILVNRSVSSADAEGLRTALADAVR